MAFYYRSWLFIAKVFACGSCLEAAACYLFFSLSYFGLLEQGGCHVGQALRQAQDAQSGNDWMDSYRMRMKK